MRPSALSLTRTFGLTLTLTSALLSSSLATPAAAAPKKQQQCIAAAESGQQLRSTSKLIEARRAFGACTANTCPAVIRRDCGRWIDELDLATPTITVKLEDATGAEVAEGRVLMDGEPLPRASDGRATPIDPGVHRFAWLRDEGSSVEEQFIVREGEHNRVLVLRVPPVTLGPPPPVTREAPAPGPLPWVVGGAGVALATAGVIFWGIGLNDRSTLSSTCASSHSCAQSDVESSHTKLVIGDVLIGVGLVAMVGAAYLFLRPGSERSATTTSAR
jgi:hypothetical protein